MRLANLNLTAALEQLLNNKLLSHEYAMHQFHHMVTHIVLYSTARGKSKMSWWRWTFPFKAWNVYRMFIALLYPDDDTNINEQVSVQMQLFHCTHYNIHIFRIQLRQLKQFRYHLNGYTTHVLIGRSIWRLT